MWGLPLRPWLPYFSHTHYCCMCSFSGVKINTSKFQVWSCSFTPATKLSEVLLLTPARVAPKYRHCLIKV